MYASQSKRPKMLRSPNVPVRASGTKLVCQPSMQQGRLEKRWPYYTAAVCVRCAYKSQRCVILMAAGCGLRATEPPLSSTAAQARSGAKRTNIYIYNHISVQVRLGSKPNSRISRTSPPMGSQLQPHFSPHRTRRRQPRQSAGGACRVVVK